MTPSARLRRLVRAHREFRKQLRACRDDAPAFFRGVRAGLGLSQSQMARHLGVSQVWLSYVECGKKRPGFALLRSLSLLAAGPRLHPGPPRR